MVSFLSNLIRWASVIRDGKDDAAYPIQQITYLGKTVDCVMIFPYGMHANVDGDSLAPLFSFGGSTENRGAIPTSMTRRSQLGSGDVEFYSPVSRSRVTIRANGNIEVEAKGDLTATVSGAAAVTASSATVTAPAINLIGNVTVTGNMIVSGTITNAGKDVGFTHGHTQGVDSDGDSQAPISGVT